MLATSAPPRRSVLRLAWQERILKAFWQDLIYSGADTTGKTRRKKPFLSTKLKCLVFIWFFQTISNHPFLKRKFDSINLNCICLRHFAIFFAVILITHFSFPLFILASLPHYNILYTSLRTFADWFFQVKTVSDLSTWYILLFVHARKPSQT